MGDAGFSVSVQNATPLTVNCYWVEVGTNKLVPMASVGPHQTYCMTTYETHRFIFRDAALDTKQLSLIDKDPAVVYEFAAQEGVSQVVITLPLKIIAQYEFLETRRQRQSRTDREKLPDASDSDDDAPASDEIEAAAAAETPANYAPPPRPHPMEGQYCILSFLNTENDNDWLHVTVEPKPDDEGKFMWKTRAGPSWTINADGTLEEDCPYYATGATECFMARDDETGRVTHLVFNGFTFEREPGLEEGGMELWLRTPTDSVAANNRHAFVVQTASDVADPRDFTVLATIAAACITSAKDEVTGRPRPIVVLPDATGSDDDVLQNFIKRLNPAEIHVVTSKSDKRNVNVLGTAKTSSIALEDDDPVAAALTLSKESVSSSSPTPVVLSRAEYYGDALLATSIAAHAGAHLLFVSSDDTEKNQEVVAHVKNVLGSEGHKAICVGCSAPSSDLEGRCVSVSSFLEAASLMEQQRGVPLHYVALTNPGDRDASSGAKVPKLSLLAPLFAAVNGGLACPIPDMAVVPKAFPDASLPTERHMKRLKHVYCNELRKCIPRDATITVVGHPDAMPMYKFDTPTNQFPAQPVITDMPYHTRRFSKAPSAFASYATARVYTHTLALASYYGARVAGYPWLKDGKWDKSYLECGQWSNLLCPAAERAGFTRCQLPKKKGDRPVNEEDVKAHFHIEAGLVLHSSHSNTQMMGHFYTTGNKTLFPAATILASGCHVGAIDYATRTVASDVFGRNAIAFTGPTRSPTGPSTNYDNFWTTGIMCDGLSLGAANRQAYNRHNVQLREGGPVTDFNMTIRLNLGDAGVIPYPRQGSDVGSPRQFVAKPNGSSNVDVTFTGDYAMEGTDAWLLEEWKSKRNPLFNAVAVGAGTAYVWVHEECRNSTDLYATFELALKPNSVVKGVALTSEGASLPANFFNGKFHVALTGNGGKTLLFRVMPLEYDCETGNISNQLTQATFKVDFETGGFA